MAVVNVQFADASQKVVVGYFCDEQDQAAFPNQGQIDQTDARYAAFYTGLGELLRDGMPAPTATGL